MIGGTRVPKSHIRIEAYGTVDELNSIVGIVRTYLMDYEDRLGDDYGWYSEMLRRIQNELFDLGADLCIPEDGSERALKALRITQGQVDRLEREIDQLNEKLAPLRSFVLPGGSAAAAQLHVARTVCRRAERLMVKLAQDEPVGEAALKYANRLSDFLLVAARAANLERGGDVLWIPGGNR